MWTARQSPSQRRERREEPKYDRATRLKMAPDRWISREKETFSPSVHCLDRNPAQLAIGLRNSAGAIPSRLAAPAQWRSRTPPRQQATCAADGLERLVHPF